MVTAVAKFLVAAFPVWYFAIRDSSNDDGTGTGTGRVAATEDDVSDLAAEDKQPIYWADSQPQTSHLELTQASDGNIYVRYLTDNAPIGSSKPAYLTVGTYPFHNALHAVKVIAKEPGGKSYDLLGGGLAVQNSNSTTSVYVAYPDQDF